MVSILAFYSDDPSLHVGGDMIFLYKKTKISKKRSSFFKAFDTKLLSVIGPFPTKKDPRAWSNLTKTNPRLSIVKDKAKS